MNITNAIMRHWFSQLFALALISFSVTTAIAGDKTQMLVDTGGIWASPAVADVTSMRLTVADPSGEIVYSKSSKGATGTRSCFMPT